MKTAVALFAAALSVVALSTNASAQKGFSSPKAVAAEKLTDKNSNSPTKSKNPIKSSDIHFPETPNILVPKPRGGKEQVEIATPELVANISTYSGPGGTTYMTGGGGKPSDNLGGLCCPGGTTFMTGGASGTSWREVGGLPSPATFLTGGADTSFGTRSGGGFKLASNKAELRTGAIGVIHPSYMPNPDKLWGLDEDSLTEGSAGEIDILSNTSIVLGNEAIAVIHPDYVPIDPEVPGEAIGVIHPTFVPIDPETPSEAMAYRLIAALIKGDPDRPKTTSVVAPTGETQGSNLATAIEYDLIAALIGGTADPGGEGTYTTTTGEADAAKTFDYCVIYPERCTVSEIERPTFGPHILTFDD